MTLVLLTSVSVFANSPDCKLLKGASIGSKAILVDITGYGDINYHLRTFELLRNSGRNLSKLIKSELANELSSEKLQRAVLRIAANLDNSTQNGYGDVHYWSKLASVKLNDLENATSSLSDLTDITCN